MYQFICLKNVTRADIVRACEQATANFLAAGWLRPGERFEPEEADADGAIHVVGGDSLIYLKMSSTNMTCADWCIPEVNDSVLDTWRNDETVQFPEGAVLRTWFNLKDVKQFQVLACAMGIALMCVDGCVEEEIDDEE